MNIKKSHLTINEWAEEDKPREKLLKKGAQALTNASDQETEKKVLLS